jgi:hypothetical protein
MKKDRQLEDFFDTHRQSIDGTGFESRLANRLDATPRQEESLAETYSKLEKRLETRDRVTLGQRLVVFFCSLAGFAAFLFAGGYAAIVSAFPAIANFFAAIRLAL